MIGLIRFHFVCDNFAVKVLDWGEDGLSTADDLRISFEQEVAVWQKLDHPNVTKVAATLLLFTSSRR